MPIQLIQNSQGCLAPSVYFSICLPALCFSPPLINLLERQNGFIRDFMRPRPVCVCVRGENQTLSRPLCAGAFMSYPFYKQLTSMRGHYPADEC